MSNAVQRCQTGKTLDKVFLREEEPFTRPITVNGYRNGYRTSPSGRLALADVRICSGKLMPEEGVEPSRPEGHGILSPARLPVSPLRPQSTIIVAFEAARLADARYPQLAFVAVRLA